MSQATCELVVTEANDFIRSVLQIVRVINVQGLLTKLNLF